MSLFAFLVNKSSKDNRSSLRIDLEEIDLNVVQEVILIEINGEFVNEFMNIAEEDERLRVWKTKTFKEILNLNWVIAIRLLLNDLFYSSELVALSSSFNVLEIDIFVFS